MSICGPLFLFLFFLAGAFGGVETAFAQGRSWEMMDELDLEDTRREAPPELMPLERSEPATQAEPAPTSQKALVVLGMRKREVVREFGEPDSKKQEGQGSIERWVYGKSTIFFDSDVVSAWVDNGDLSVRSLVPKRKRRAFERDDEFALEGWKKVWKKEEEIKVDTREDVLNDLVSDEEAK